jgi:hypothetical protein
MLKIWKRADVEPALAVVARAVLEGLEEVDVLDRALVGRLDVARAREQPEAPRGLGGLLHGAGAAAGHDAHVRAEQLGAGRR